MDNLGVVCRADRPVGDANSGGDLLECDVDYGVDHPVDECRVDDVGFDASTVVEAADQGVAV